MPEDTAAPNYEELYKMAKEQLEAATKENAKLKEERQKMMQAQFQLVQIVNGNVEGAKDLLIRALNLVTDTKIVMQKPQKLAEKKEEA